VSDFVTVLRKELLEIVADRHSLHGLAFQAAAIVGTCGVLVPWLSPGGGPWNDPGAIGMLYLGFPSMLTALVAADLFAGELERGTLETLLATPLSDAAIVGGKAAAAAIVGVAVSYLSLLATAAVSIFKHGGFAPDPAMLLWAVGGAFGSSLITGALAVAVSSLTTVARSAQQIALVLSFLAMMALTAQAGRWRAHFARRERVIAIDLGLLGLGGLAVRAAVSLFRRERMLERR
jgi:ABC-2 type transport system permease protein